MRTAQDLRQLQAYPLEMKVMLTKQRIREWANYFGTDGVYVSFSGGKDSTVLLHIVREMYGDKIPAVFCDTGLEYPEIRNFVKTFDNVTWLKPKLTFRQVIKKYGYPFISKEVSERVYYAQKYLTWWREQNSLDRQTDAPSPYGVMDLFGVKRKSNERKIGLKERIVPEWVLDEISEQYKGGTYKIRELTGKMTQGDGSPTIFDYRKWKWLAFSPYTISNKCCDVMKKGIAHSYIAKTWRFTMTAQMAEESRLRKMQWIKNSCNGFDMKRPISNPMSFWLENDVLQYIKQNNIPICSVYGDIVEVEELPGQMSWDEYAGFDIGTKKLMTTGCNRTGCMFCGYGCHLEKPGEGRFERMKETHPKQYEYIMKPWDKGGLGYKQVIDWLNENGNLNIRY